MLRKTHEAWTNSKTAPRFCPPPSAVLTSRAAPDRVRVECVAGRVGRTEALANRDRRRVGRLAPRNPRPDLQRRATRAITIPPLPPSTPPTAWSNSSARANAGHLPPPAEATPSSLKPSGACVAASRDRPRRRHPSAAACQTWRPRVSSSLFQLKEVRFVDWAAIIAPGLHLAFENNQTLTLDGRTIVGETARRDIRVCGAGAFVVLKALAFHIRGENKDAYDLSYLLRNYGRGVSDVAAQLRPFSAREVFPVLVSLRSNQFRFQFLDLLLHQF